MTDSDKITVVGAGLAGSMLALLLAQTGEEVQVIEKRSDIREELQHLKDGRAKDGSTMGMLTNSSKRSINLALSHRGIEALKQARLWDHVQPLLIPMKGRSVHAVNGTINFQPYGHGDQAIYSVPRLDLNVFLLNELDKRPNATLNFNMKVQRVDPAGVVMVEQSGSTTVKYPSKVVIGADGAFSSIRDSLAKCSRMDFSQEFLSAGYREFTISPTADDDFALPNHESLHIWPRHEFMMIALPNPDKSFTATLFAPWKGKDGLENLKDDEHVLDFFRSNFPDLMSLMPDLLEQFADGCSSPLLSVVCSPWVCENTLLIGDAAHAAVPFYGQGMNAAFEDALLFFEIWSTSGFPKSKEDAKQVLQEFSVTRQPAGVGLVELSLRNFREMSSLTARPWFVWKKRVEALLHRIAPSMWTPLYTMVSFTRTPYHEAIERARVQDRALGSILALTCTGIAAAAAVVALKVVQHSRR